MPPRASVLNRLGTPFLALSEQAIFAVVNLLLQVLLARTVTPEQFGAYSVANAFFFIVAIIHQTCLVEPMFVFGATRFRMVQRQYHAALRWRWTIIFSLGVIAIGGPLAAIAWMMDSPVALDLAVFTLVSPIILYLWLLRRIAFALGQIHLATIAVAIYAVVLFALAGGAWAAGGLTTLSAILFTGIAATMGSLALRIGLRRAERDASRGDGGGDLPAAEMVRAHVHYGRWALGAEALAWALINGPILILPLWLGLASAAQLRALNLVFMPLLQVVSVASMLLLRSHARTGGGAPRQVVLRDWALLAGGAVLYGLLVCLMGPYLLTAIFGPDYMLDATTLAIAAFGAVMLVSSQAFVVVLRAQERTRAVFTANLVALAIFGLLAPFAMPAGVTGMLLAQATAWATALLVTAALSERRPAEVVEG